MENKDEIEDATRHFEETGDYTRLAQAAYDKMKADEKMEAEYNARHRAIFIDDIRNGIESSFDTEKF